MDLPSGVIVLWFGSIGSIPAGFVICDGTLGTPNLKDKFLVGSGSTYVVDETGGAVNHNHAFTGDGHVHQLAAGAGVGPGAGFDTETDSVQVTGTTDNGSTLPPFHSLAYIMKT